MQHYSSKELKSILEANGWFVVRVKGDHWHFKHKEIKGTITLTHPVKDVSRIIVKSIIDKSGLDL